VAEAFTNPGWVPPQRRTDVNFTVVSYVLRHPKPMCYGLGHCEADAMKVGDVEAVIGHAVGGGRSDKHGAPYSHGCSWSRQRVQTIIEDALTSQFLAVFTTRVSIHKLPVVSFHGWR
jgi:hypothetical protein